MDGVCITMMNYAEWLNREHGETCLVAPRNPGQPRPELPYPVYLYGSVSTVVRKPYRMGLPDVDPAYRRKMQHLNVDIIHAHSPYVAGQEALRYARRLGVPLVGTFHSKFYDDFYRATRSEAIARYATKQCVRFFERADAVWAVNPGSAETLRTYGYRGSIEIMPNGCDPIQVSHPEALIGRVNARWALEPDAPLFLFVGQQIWAKNIKTLLDAMTLLPREFRAKLVVAGDGADAREIVRYAREKNLGDSVLFVGKILDRELLYGLYLRAAAFAFPSIYDNAPLVIREAASMHCPSILVRGSNAAEDFNDNETVFLCENSAESLAGRMRDILTDTVLRERVGRACSQIAVPWRDIVTRVAARYTEIIEEFEKKRR